MKAALFLGIVIGAAGTAICIAQTPQAPRASTEVTVSDANVKASYSNFSRVTSTPEELIVDFGLNPQPVGPPKAPIVIDHRIVMNFYTAKRLTAALQLSIERHEKVFGEIETDIQKRVKANP